MKTLLMFIVLLVGMTACAPHTAGVMASSTGEVRIDNRSLSQEVSLAGLNVRGEGGFLKANGTIVSKVSTDLRLQYKFTWFDSNGATVEDEGVSWKALKLHGKQQIQVTAVAPNATAARCELYVRKAFSN